MRPFIIHHSSLIICPLEFAPLKKLGALLLIVLSACGKRGDPHPPVPLIPHATSDLVVTQRGGKVTLAWSYPSVTTSGKALGKIRRVVVYRVIEELPAPSAAPVPPTTTTAPASTATSAPPSTATAPAVPAPAVPQAVLDAALPQPVALFAKVPPIAIAPFNRLKERIDAIEESALPAATAGAKLTYEDAPELQTKDGHPVRVDYAVVTEGLVARSDLSNIAFIVPLDVPVPPGDVVATAKPEGVVLTWTAPAQTISGAEKPKLFGYNVYRVNPGDVPGDLDNPLNSAPIQEATYTDVPSYGTFQYHVTAVASPFAPRVESDPSAAATATFKDLLPPPTPGGLNALVEPHAVQLVWDAVEAGDLAGYKVYRTEGTGTEKLVPVATIALTKDPITVTTFRDTTINVGISYYYEVASVDKSGNESKRAKTDWVLAPKTP
jgi:hypothetical protein